MARATKADELPDQEKPVEKPKVKVSKTDYVTAIIEKRKFNMTTGERESKAFPQTFNPVDWAQFQEAGPKLGWYVNEIVEAPAGIDLTYKNPGSK